MNGLQTFNKLPTKGNDWINAPKWPKLRQTLRQFDTNGRFGTVVRTPPQWKMNGTPIFSKVALGSAM